LVSVKVVGEGPEGDELREILDVVRPGDDLKVIVDCVRGMVSCSGGSTKVRIVDGSAFFSTVGRAREDVVNAAVLLAANSLGLSEPVERFCGLSVTLGREVPKGKKLVAVCRGRGVHVKFKTEPEEGRYGVFSVGTVTARRTRSTCEIELITSLDGFELLSRRVMKVWRVLEDLARGKDTGSVARDVASILGRG